MRPSRIKIVISLVVSFFTYFLLCDFPYLITFPFVSIPYFHSHTTIKKEPDASSSFKVLSEDVHRNS